jgi:hypothetical protein
MAKQDSGAKDMSAKMGAQEGSEEKEQTKRQIDEAATAELFGRLNSEIEKRNADAKAKAAELAKVEVKDEDIAVLAHELGVSKDVAKVKLQEKKGNLKNALTANLYLGQ